MKKTAIAALCLMTAACGEGDITEISRHPSPDGKTDVVVGRMKAGETEPYMVVMTNKPGDNVAKGARLIMIDKGDAPQPKWVDPQHLEVSCDNARVWSYRNFWIHPNSGKVVSVALKCGTQGWGG